ncbi:hypothetical protein [Methylocella silvestris]|uniref:hypothetical protein n=1 Tax=Methylocella silvestris TaxID=199596 RepID=UPI001650CAF2|nr:hypothetical protein [Methylocella silvestris]
MVRIEHRKSDVADKPELLRQRVEKAIGRRMRFGQPNRFGDKYFRQPHRHFHLDQRRVTGLYDDNAGANYSGQNVDEDEAEDQLCAKREHPSVWRGKGWRWRICHVSTIGEKGSSSLDVLWRMLIAASQFRERLVAVLPRHS